MPNRHRQMPNGRQRDGLDDAIDDFFEQYDKEREQQKKEEESKAYWEEFGRELKEIRQRHRASQEASKNNPSNP